MINKTSILLIQDDIQALSSLTEKCLDAGISERNIFAVSEADSAQRYLEIAGISYVIIDAEMYNFVVASLIERFSEYFPIKILITGSNPEQRTIRTRKHSRRRSIWIPRSLGRISLQTSTYIW